MKDDELFDVWKKTDKKEKQMFKEHRGAYEQLAQRKSKDVFRKIERNMVVETIIGLLFLMIITGVLFCNKHSGNNLYLFNCMFLFSVSIPGVIIYVKYLLAVRKVNESSVVESLIKKREILSTYVNRLNFYNYIVTPLSFFIGVYTGFSVGSRGKEVKLEFHEIAIMFFFLLLIVMLLIWLTKKYIYALYGKYLKIIEEIYEDLVSEE